MRVRAGAAAERNRAAPRWVGLSPARLIQPGTGDRADGNRCVGDLCQESAAGKDWTKSVFSLGSGRFSGGCVSARSIDDGRFTGLDSAQMDRWLDHFATAHSFHRVTIPV